MVEKLYWAMCLHFQQNPGGIAQKAIAGIEVALWDIKARALNLPLYELFGRCGISRPGRSICRFMSFSAGRSAIRSESTGLIAAPIAPVTRSSFPGNHCFALWMISPSWVVRW
jgi:hypothetical protein